MATSMSIPFCKGDEVKAKSSMLVFWMTVKEVIPAGFCICYFGTSGRYAGSFLPHELEFHGGTELTIPKQTHLPAVEHRL